MKKLESYRATYAALGMILGGLTLGLLLWGMGTASQAVASKLPEHETASAQAALPESAQVLWQEDGVPVCTAIRGQGSPRIIGDGEGGAIVVWNDGRSGISTDLYAQRVYSNGTPAWITDGIAVSSAPGNQVAPQIVGDGAEGAIVTWYDDRGGLSDIYAQRVYSDGTPAWTTDGISLSVAPGDERFPMLASDGFGGAIVAWYDNPGDADIYAQRVYSDGTMAWATNGVTLCVATGHQHNTQITGDGVSGAIVAWEDGRGGNDITDIYAQRVYSDGTAAWAVNGVSLCVANGSQRYPKIVGDGDEGAIVTWEDFRSGNGSDVYVQRVYSNGTVAWATNGVSVCAASGAQSFPEIISDGAGGAIVTWQDERLGEWDVYAQRVYSDGTVAWATDGIPVAVESSYQWYPDIASDGASGAIITWQDHRTSAHIFAQRVYSNGTLAWVTNGIELAPTELWELQQSPRIAADGVGGAVVTWYDSRDVFGYTGIDIYAQRVGGVTYTRHLPLVMRGGFGGALYGQYLPLVLWDGSGADRGVAR